jgi:hypothetical protein
VVLRSCITSPQRRVTRMRLGVGCTHPYRTDSARARARLGHSSKSLATDPLRPSGLDYEKLYQQETSRRQIGIGITPRAGAAG